MSVAVRARSDYRLVFAATGLAIIVVAELILRAMGHNWICPCGTVKLWNGVTNSADNSQHLTDWYTFSHVINGFCFYGLFWLIGRKGAWPVGLRFMLAVAVECTWEIVENTPMVIDRYRATTIALDYYGDSVVNSMSDIAAMMFGFALARKAPVWTAIAIVVGIETMMAVAIRDNMTLNIVMLIHPFEVIRRWQMGS